jgi:hypothetical protein
MYGKRWRSARSDPMHLALSPSHCLMRILGSDNSSGPEGVAASSIEARTSVFIPSRARRSDTPICKRHSQFADQDSGSRCGPAGGASGKPAQCATRRRRQFLRAPGIKTLFPEKNPAWNILTLPISLMLNKSLSPILHARGSPYILTRLRRLRHHLTLQRFGILSTLRRPRLLSVH